MKTVLVLGGWGKVERPHIVEEALSFLVEDKNELTLAHRQGTNFDAIVSRWAKRNGVKEIVFKPRISDRRAGVQRAGSLLVRRMIQDQNPDHCLVFVDSRRTQSILGGAVRLLGGGRVSRVDQDGKIWAIEAVKEIKKIVAEQ